MMNNGIMIIFKLSKRLVFMNFKVISDEIKVVNPIKNTIILNLK